MFAVALAVVARGAFAQAYCAPPKTMPKSPPPPPPPAVCQSQVCGKCTTSPCYVDSGIYVNDAIDLNIPTNGFPLLVARHYDSSLTVDGPLGIGWTSSLTPHLYYATYLYSANAYQYEVNVIMPDGARYRFTANGDGTFAPPTGRRDALVRNANGTFTMTLERSRSVLSFAADGSLTTMADNFGNALAFTYDGSGRLQTVADASGSSRALTVTWNPQGRIADISDSSTPARHIVYSYNADGTLAGMRDPVTPSGQQSLNYTYTTGRYAPVLARIDDRWGRLVSRLTWQSDGKISTYTEGDYDLTNPSSSSGERYVYSYGQGATSKANSVGSINHAYTTNGLITDHAQYDARGNPILLSDGSGGAIFQYDGRDNITVMTTYPGEQVNWYYTYDSNYPDQVSTITPKDSQGNIKTNFASWLVEYNLPTETAPGALKALKRYDTARSTTQPIAQFVYDAKGHITSATDAALRVSTFLYDAAGNRTSATVAGQTTTYAYDHLGRVTSMTDAAGHMTSFTYDALDRLLTVRLPRPSSTSTLEFVTTYSYDNLENGIVYTTATDANGRVTKTGYDAMGNVVRTVDGLGNVTQFTYQYNLLKSVTDANGNITTYAYDGNRNLTSTTFPNGAVESYARQWDGTVTAITDRRGVTAQYSRDGTGRVTSITYSGGITGTVTYTYNGELLVGASSGSTSTTFTYDTFWRLASETRAGQYTITYQNAPQSAILTNGYILRPVTGQPGPTVTVGYNRDANQRVYAVDVAGVGTFAIDYDALGHYSKITSPFGQTREFTYDDQGRVTLVKNRHPNAGDIASFQYDYDYNWTTGTYSMLGQRTSVTMTGSATPYPYNSQVKYTYDGNYQLTGAIQGSSVRSWTYDAIGNRTSASGPGYTAYTYYKNGTNPLNGQRLQNDGLGGDFTYDAAGNVLGRGGTTLYTWDYAGRLTTAGGTSYTYDDMGMRASATSGGVTTKYITFGPHTIGERVGTTARDYVFAPGVDEPLAKIESGTLTLYAIDGLGSVVASTDVSGNILTATSFDPWGVPSPLLGTGGFFGYTGRESAGGSLWFLRARNYDPSIGRFVSEDPAHYLGASTYAYVGNMPIAFVDPSGAVAVSRSVSSHEEDWQDVVRHCGGKYVNGCANLHGHVDCICSAGCDIATHEIVYRPSVSISTSIDVHIATNSPYEPLAKIRQHEFEHVDEYNRFIDGLVSRARDLESRQYSSEFVCKMACRAFLIGNTARYVGKQIGGFFHNEGF